MKKIFFPLLVAAVAVSTFLFSCRGGFSKTLTFSRDEIQAKVEEKFPIKRAAAVVTLVLTNPDIVLTNGSDRIGLKADASAELPGSGLAGLGQLIGIGGDAYKGSVLIDGDVEYDPAEGTIYFTNGKIKELNIEKIPEQLNKPVTELANAAASNNLNKVLLFTLNEKDMKEKAAKFLLKKVRIRDGKLEVIVGL